MVESGAVIQADFASIVGDARVITDPAVCAGFAIDGITPHSVVYPTRAEEAAEVLRCAAAHDLVVIPCRNATKLDIGASPRRYDVALSLKDMNQVWYYEPDDLVVSVEPGMKFGDLQHFLARHRLWIPLDPGGGERASVGGILAANAAGPLRLQYGGPRDMVLGMKIATPEGRIVKTGGRVVKNVAGYDLAKLVIGSYGTLGVIVEATFKLYPQVANRVTWAIEPIALETAREIRRELLRSPLRPLRLVLLNHATRRHLADATSSPRLVTSSEVNLALWIEAGGSDRVLARYTDELGVLAAKHGAPLHKLDRDAAGETWERIADFGSGLTREQQAPLVVRAALPIASCEEFLERAEKESRLGGFETAGLVQLGVGVVDLGIGLNASGSANTDPEPRGDGVQPQAQAPGSRYPAATIIERLRQAAITLGGTLVVTHCPAELKSKLDVWGPPGDDFEVMRKLKMAWDPKSTLSPGRFIGGL